MRGPESGFPMPPEEGRAEASVPKAELSFFHEVKLDESSKDKLRAEVAEIIANPDRFIDKGGAGSVYRLSEGVCLKVPVDRSRSSAAHAMNFGNSLEVEAAFLRRFSGVVVEGVRAPRSYGYWVERGAPKPSGLIMEQLDAVNLQHLILGKVPMPKGFDPAKFLDALGAYLGHMHDEAKVLHGDLFARNVMVDIATGAPRVIDFGRSKDLALLREAERVRETDAEWELFDEIEEAVSGLTK